MASWPGTLPQTPLLQGFSQLERDTKIRSGMSYGPAKVRKRTTVIIYDVKMSLLLSTADKDILKTFYLTTTNEGIDKFDWVDHLNGGTVNYKFVGVIAWSRRSNLWFAQMNFEIVP